MHHLNRTLFIVFLLCTPIFYVFTAESGAYKQGRLLGLFFWPILWCLLIRWGINSFRKPKSNKLCALSIILTGGSALAVSLPSILADYEILDRTISTTIAALTILGFVSAFIIAVIGLAKYSNEEFDFGKKESITSIIISIIFIGSFTYGFVSGINNRINYDIDDEIYEKKDHIDHEYNFTLNVPDGVNSVDPSYTNADASWIARDRHSQLYHMVIAEKLGTTFDLNKLTSFAKDNLKMEVKDCNIGPINSITINGLSANSFSSSGKVNNLKIKWKHHIIYKNGFGYQISSWAGKRKFNQLNDSHQALVNSFKMLDEELVYNESELHQITELNNDVWGYHIDLGELDASAWDPTEDDYLYAQDGVLIGDDTGALIYCYQHNEIKAHKDALLSVFFHDLGIEYPNNKVQIDKEHSTDNEIVYTYHRKDADSQWFYQITYFPHNTHDTLIAYWSSNNFPQRALRFFDRVTIEKQRGYSHLKDVPDDILKKQAEMDNKLGLYYYQQEDFKKSLQFFKRAFKLRSENSVYMVNAFDSLNRLKLYKNALDWYKEKHSKHKDKDEVISWLAWFNAQIDDHKSAVKYYTLLFNADYREHEDFSQYIRSLSQIDETHESIKSIVNKYDPEGSIHEVQIAYVDYLQQNDLHKESIDTLNALIGDIETPPNIAYSLFISYDALEDYQSIIDLCEDLVNREHNSSSIWHWKAEAELSLKWYRKAKKSYEKSLELNPQNEAVKDSIRYVSGLLGGGDNINIKNEIKPVALPAEFANRVNSDPQEYTDVNFSFVYKYNCTRYIKGETSVETTYRKLKINTQSGVSQNSTLVFDFNPLYEQIYVNKIIVRDKEGAVKSTGDLNTYYVLDRNQKLKTYERSLYAPVAGLSIGDTLEYIVSIKQNTSISKLSFDTHWLSASKPVQYAGVCIRGDIDEIAYKHYHCEIIPSSDELIWSANNPPVYHSEPLMADIDTDFSVLHFASNEGSWANVGSDEYRTIEPMLPLEDSVTELAQSLAKNNDSPLKQFCQYISDNIVYQAIEFGTRGVEPKVASKTIAEKYGDCKDMSILLYALCNAVGIKAELALVNSSGNVIDTIHSADQFDHMIVYVPDFGFIDPTVKNFFQSNATPPGLRNTQILIIRKNNSELVPSPNYNILSEMTCKQNIISNENNVIIKEFARISGYHAYFIKYELTNLDKQELERWLTELIHDSNRSAQLIDFKVNGTNDISKDVEIHYEYTIPYTLTKSGKTFKIPAIWFEYYAAYQAIGKRYRDFQINYGLKIQRNTSISCSDTNTITMAQANSSQNSSGISWTGKSEQRSKKEISKHVSVELIPGRYPKTNYKNFVNNCNLLINFTNSEIEVNSHQP